MTPQRLRAIRTMHGAWLEGIRSVDPDDIEEMAALEILTGAVVGSVPELLDEIERLQGSAPERVRTVKMDSRGGNA